MNKKLIIIIVLLAIVIIAAFFVSYSFRQDQSKTKVTAGDKELSQYSLDLNCNRKNISPQFADVCKNYTDKQLLNEKCFLPVIAQEFEARCSDYFCAQKRDAGMTCE